MKASGKKQSEAGLVCDSAIIEKYFERDESAILDTDRKYVSVVFLFMPLLFRDLESPSPT